LAGLLVTNVHKYIGLHITLGVKVLSSTCRPPTLPTKLRLRRRRSQDQAHGTAAQAERRRRGACFPSMINAAVRSSADAAQGFKDQRAASSRTASTRRKSSASLQEPAGFCFTSSLDTTQVLPTVPQQEVGCADGLKKRWICLCRTLCKTCVADFLRPENMRYLQVGQRVGGARYTCAV